MKRTLYTIAFGITLAGLGIAVPELCTGCKPAEQPRVDTVLENAAAVAQYKALLAPCRAKGRAARDAGASQLASFEVFDACADAVDAELCRTSSLRCEGGIP